MSSATNSGARNLYRKNIGSFSPYMRAKIITQKAFSGGQMRHLASSCPSLKRTIQVAAAAFMIALLFPLTHLRAADDRAFPFPYVQEDLPNGLRLVTIP